MCAVRVFNAWKKWRNKQPTEEGVLGRYVHDLHVMNNREMNTGLQGLCMKFGGKVESRIHLLPCSWFIAFCVLEYHSVAGRLTTVNFSEGRLSV